MTMFLMILAAIGWGLWPIFDKMALRYNMHPIVIGVVYSAVSLGFDGVALLVGSSMKGGIDWTINKGAIWLVVGSTVSCVAMLAYTFALRRVETSVVVAVTGAYPLITMLASVLILNEQMTWQRGFGTALVVAGIFLVSRP